MPLPLFQAAMATFKKPNAVALSGSVLLFPPEVIYQIASESAACCEDDELGRNILVTK
jgi:hypothetical protein